MLFSVISSCFGFPVGTIGGKYKEHVYFWDPAMRDEKGRGVRTVLLQRQPKGFSAQTQLGTPNPTNPQKSPLGN